MVVHSHRKLFVFYTVVALTVSGCGMNQPTAPVGSAGIADSAASAASAASAKSPSNAASTPKAQ